ncbi:MAG TPA: hypothetical protein VJN63_07625 [Thermoplasmata archaeon]|nr:hypothetical protein [Thermoplasmata archaeon]
MLRTDLEGVRETAAQSPKISLSALGNAMFDLQGIEARVRHAEQGYSGFSPAIRIEEDALDRLYEYDYAMIEGLDRAAGNVPALRAAAEAADKAAFDKGVLQLRADLRAFDDAFKRRIEAITGTGAKR